jgi:hypothetical protein
VRFAALCRGYTEQASEAITKNVGKRLPYG